MPMTDEQFCHTLRAIASALLDIRARYAIEPNEFANLAGGALVEVIGQCLGSAGATIDRIRDIADRFEAEALERLTAH